MADWSMVWLQQKGDDPQIFTPRMIDPTKPLKPEIERSVTNLQRMTEARKAKIEKSPWMKRIKVANYIEDNQYKWNKMELYADCKNCVYTSTGSVKKTKKI